MLVLVYRYCVCYFNDELQELLVCVCRRRGFLGLFLQIHALVAALGTEARPSSNRALGCSAT